MILPNLEELEKAGKSHITRKKMEKKNAIIKSAFELFVEKGIAKTSIDDIVKGANMAKGTFYLYFKDKDALLDEMVYSLCFEAVSKAFIALDEEHRSNSNMEIGDSVCFFAETLLGMFMENKEMLPIIHKNLFKGLYSVDSKTGSPLSSKFENSVIERVINRFQSEFINLGGDVEEAKKRFYMIVEIVNAVAYNAVIEGWPYRFEEIKPLLLRTIRCLAYPQFN